MLELEVRLAIARPVEVTVMNGRAAIDAAYRLRPDVIVMDVAMPDLDGISATRELKQDPRTVDIPVVILTAYPIRAIKGGALEAGTLRAGRA
jgi:CheY-like chemotaxis protein